MRSPEENRGIVYLVGAGPGDPELLTLKGFRLLKSCDVVLYDRLVGAAILELIRPDCRLIPVGKKGGFYSTSQDQIHRILREEALLGNCVVRLKGGDPFLFGRGGEEARFLFENNIPFEVVPGISSGLAVPALAGIPVTHRRISSSVAFITGHQVNGAPDAIQWKHLAQGIDTLVFLMPIRNLSQIVSNLVTNGRSITTPAALIEAGSLPEQRVLTSTLGDIARKSREFRIQSPALLVVGEVVEMREWLTENVAALSDSQNSRKEAYSLAQQRGH